MIDIIIAVIINKIHSSQGCATTISHWLLKLDQIN